MHEDILSLVEMMHIIPGKHLVHRECVAITHHLPALLTSLFINKVADQHIQCGLTAGKLMELCKNLPVYLFLNPVIAVNHLKIQACGICNSCIHGRTMSPVFLMDCLHDRRILFGIAISNLCGTVLRTVINNQNFNLFSTSKK